MEIKKPIENVLEETLRNLRAIIDVDCIVGQTITGDGISIIPISKVSLGFVSGGGEYENKKNKRQKLYYPFAGGSGGGCNLTPIGFLILKSGTVEFVKVTHENNFEKMIDLVDGFLKSFK